MDAPAATDPHPEAVPGAGRRHGPLSCSCTRYRLPRTIILQLYLVPAAAGHYPAAVLGAGRRGPSSWSCTGCRPTRAPNSRKCRKLPSLRHLRKSAEGAKKEPAKKITPIH